MRFDRLRTRRKSPDVPGALVPIGAAADTLSEQPAGSKTSASKLNRSANYRPGYLYNQPPYNDAADLDNPPTDSAPPALSPDIGSESYCWIFCQVSGRDASRMAPEDPVLRG